MEWRNNKNLILVGSSVVLGVLGFAIGACLAHSIYYLAGILIGLSIMAAMALYDLYVAAEFYEKWNTANKYKDELVARLRKVTNASGTQLLTFNRATMSDLTLLVEGLEMRAEYQKSASAALQNNLNEVYERLQSIKRDYILVPRDEI